MANSADGSPGLNKLARVMSKRAKEISESMVGDIEPDFGTIGKDGSLTTNMFPVPIPKGEYQLGRLVSGLTLTVSGSDHSHSVTLPKVKAGDHVLVVWVRSEAVVVDVVKKS